MTEERALQILNEAGVLQKGHFLLTSGRHSDRYLQCAAVFRNPKYSEEICGALAGPWQGKGIEIVVGPAMGAVQMAYEVSRALCCENFFTERGADGKMTLRRGFRVRPGQKVLVVEDVVTTGGSVREVMNVVRGEGGVVAGVAAVVDRTGGKIGFSVPFHAAVSLNIQSWAPEDCPLCRAGAPAPVKPGSRKR